MVQKLILLSILFFSSSISYAQKISSSISSVTVYLKEGAKINHSTSVQISKGTSEIILHDLPYQLDINSIQVTFKNKGVSVQDISFERDYISKPENKDSIQVLTDSIARLNKKMDWIKQQTVVLKEEQQILSANNRTYSDANGVSTEALKSLLHFFREHALEIKQKLTVFAEESKKLKEHQRNLNAKIKELKKGNKNIGQIIVKVWAEKAMRSDIEFSYFIRNAGWTPYYDVKSEGFDKALQLTYKATVHQSTGKDWGNIDLFLSNVKPNRNNTPPKMKPVFAKIEMPKSYTDTVITFDPESYEEQITVVRSEAYIEAVKRLETSVLWKMANKQNIPSDGKKHTIKIKEENIPAKYEYYAAPLKKPYVYLIANVINYGQYDLIPGKMNIFFEETFVGKSYIDSSISSDTLAISLGQDPGIVLEREKRNYMAPKFIGSNKKETRSYEIIVRNNKRKKISLKIMDQIPISTHKNIEVALLKKDGAKHNESNGFLTWIVDLSPDKTKKLTFSYSLKYPKDKTIWEK